MRTLKMSDEILCVRYSPDQNLIAVSLLDSTVKVFYHDTLKFFLSLYGHKVNDDVNCIMSYVDNANVLFFLVASCALYGHLI